MDRFSCSPDPLGPGETGQLCFSNEALADQNITVDVQDAAEPPHGMSVNIQLNAFGIGCVAWTRPSSWQGGAFFNHPTSDTHAVVFA